MARYLLFAEIFSNEGTAFKLISLKKSILNERQISEENDANTKPNSHLLFVKALQKKSFLINKSKILMLMPGFKINDELIYK